MFRLWHSCAQDQGRRQGDIFLSHLPKTSEGATAFEHQDCHPRLTPP
jgi:hypothetical protein